MIVGGRNSDDANSNGGDWVVTMVVVANTIMAVVTIMIC